MLGGVPGLDVAHLWSLSQRDRRVLLLIGGIGLLQGGQFVPGGFQTVDRLRFSLLIKDFEKLRRDRFHLRPILDQTLHARGEIAIDQRQKRLAPPLVQPTDNRDVLDLLLGELTMGAIDRREDVAGIDEQYALIGLTLVEEPQGRWQRHRIKHIRRQRQHAVDQVFLDQRPANIGLRVARVRRRIGHHQRRASAGRAVARFLERGREEIDPEIVRVRDGLLALLGLLGLGLVARDAVGVETAVLLDRRERDIVDVERRIGEHIVEATERTESVAIIGVGGFNLAAQPVDG